MKANQVEIECLPFVGDVCIVTREFHPWTSNNAVGLMYFDSIVICIDIRDCALDCISLTFLSNNGPFSATCAKRQNGWIEGWGMYLCNVSE